MDEVHNSRLIAASPQFDLSAWKVCPATLPLVYTLAGMLVHNPGDFYLTLLHSAAGGCNPLDVASSQVRKKQLREAITFILQAARSLAFQQCVAALDGDQGAHSRRLVIVDDNMYYR